MPPDSWCEELDNSDAILSQTANFLSAKGISIADYDIGHALTTVNKGLAALRSLCGGFKANGHSGKEFHSGCKLVA